MPTVIVENVPADVYEGLQQQAAAQHQTLPEITLLLLKHALRTASQRSPRLPDFIPGAEVPAPCDLPRSSTPTVVATSRGQPRVPDPIDDAEYNSL